MHRPSTVKKCSVLVALFLVLVVIMGCSTRPDTISDRRNNERRVVRTIGVSAPAPSAKELGDNPCGNPDWAKLPPGTLESADESPSQSSDEDE